MKSRVVIGAVAGSYGVRGWVKVRSFTDPPQNILRYQPWWLEGKGLTRACEVLQGKPQGHGFVVAAVQGIETPEEAQLLKGCQVTVDRACFPPPAAGEYYQVDLLGLTVRNLDGCVLGTVNEVFETGANDVLVVSGERERLIPFVQPDTVRSVDLDGGLIEVDWDEDF